MILPRCSDTADGRESPGRSLSRAAIRHPFADGNERAGLAAAIAFLGLNDVWLEADEDAVAALVIAVADGRIGKPEFAVFVKEHAQELGWGPNLPDQPEPLAGPRAPTCISRGIPQ